MATDSAGSPGIIIVLNFENSKPGADCFRRSDTVHIAVRICTGQTSNRTQRVTSVLPLTLRVPLLSRISKVPEPVRVILEPLLARAEAIPPGGHPMEQPEKAVEG